MNERFLFFPSAGICILLALMLERWIIGKVNPMPGLWSKPVLWAVVVPVVLLSAQYTKARNLDWKDNYSLYSTDAKKIPENARLQYCVGYELVANGKDILSKGEFTGDPIKEGIEHLRLACLLEPGYVAAEIELGTAFFVAGAYDSSLFYNMLALKHSPKDPIIFNTIAGVYFMKKQYATALTFCQSALNINPHYANALKNEGLCFYNLTQYDSAIVYFRRATAEADNSPEIYGLMAKVWTVKGNADSAAYYKKLVANR